MCAAPWPRCAAAPSPAPNGSSSCGGCGRPRAANASNSPTWLAWSGSARAGCGRSWGRCAPPTATPPQAERAGAAGRGGRGRRPAGLAGPGRLPGSATPSGSSPSPASRPRRPRPRPSAPPARSATSAWSWPSRPPAGSTTITACSAAPCRPSAAGCAATRFPEPSAYRERPGPGRAGPPARQPGRAAAGRPPARRPPRRPHRRLHPVGPAGAGAAGGLATQPLPHRPRPRPNAPSRSPNSSAASTPPPTELGTTWPSLRKAFARHGLGMPARNPEAVRQRAIAAARQRTGQPATPTLDPVFVALNPGALPARERSPAELYAVGPPRRGVRHPGRQRGGRAEQRKPRPPAHHPRLGDHPPRRPQPPAGRPTRQPPRPPPHRPSRPHQPIPANPRSGRWWPMPDPGPDPL